LFPESELERERALMLQEIHAREDNPAGLAQDLLARSLYRKHPYGLPIFGEQRSVERLTPEQLRQYHAQYMDPSQMTLCVVGDVKVDQVLAFAQEAFGRSRGTAAAPTEVPPEPPIGAARCAKTVIQRAESQLLLGFHGARRSARRRPSLMLLLTATPGAPPSRSRPRPCRAREGACPPSSATSGACRTACAASRWRVWIPDSSPCTCLPARKSPSQRWRESARRCRGSATSRSRNPS